eukprot:gene9549-biopygen13780
MCSPKKTRNCTDNAGKVTKYDAGGAGENGRNAYRWKIRPRNRPGTQQAWRLRVFLQSTTFCRPDFAEPPPVHSRCGLPLASAGETALPVQ